MEIRDQITQDQLVDVRRPWQTYTEAQQGALLVDLSESLRRRAAELEDRTLVKSYLGFARAADQAGNALVRKADIPFVPDPPFSWAGRSLDEVNDRLSEITAWASSTAVAVDQPPDVRQAALELSESGHELGRQLERQRSR
ncbi:MAG TPA: hypothetical protein VGK74_13220 [Symbiobacteriaceae bacterium]|jgi:hypothetical protein